MAFKKEGDGTLLFEKKTDLGPQPEFMNNLRFLNNQL